MAAEFMRFTVKLPLCRKAFVHLHALVALRLFPPPAPKSPIEETNRTPAGQCAAMTSLGYCTRGYRAQSGRHATITCIRSAMRIADGRPRRSGFPGNGLATHIHHASVRSSGQPESNWP